MSGRTAAFLLKCLIVMPEIFNRILCPVDFDDNSMAALDFACKLAMQNAAQNFPDARRCVSAWRNRDHASRRTESRLGGWFTVKLEAIAERIPATIPHEIVTRSGVPAEQIVPPSWN